MDKLEVIKYIFAAIIASSAFTSIITHWLNRPRLVAETKKLEVEIEKAKVEVEVAELDIDEKYLSQKKIQLAELLIEVMSLREEVKSSRAEVESLRQTINQLLEALGNKDLDECINIETCMMKITRRQQLDIIKKDKKP